MAAHMAERAAKSHFSDSFQAKQTDFRLSALEGHTMRPVPVLVLDDWEGNRGTGKSLGSE